MRDASETVDSARTWFVSPHLDDVVLSAGATVHRLVRLGRPVTIVTVFAGDRPPGPLSPFARELHVAWGLGDEPIAARRDEDHRAVRELGGGVISVVHLGFPDAVYRRDGATALRYPDWPAVSSGRLHRLDLDLVDEIAGAIEPLLATVGLVGPAGPASTIGPLGAGGHVDHLVVRRALARLGVGCCYEDQPYVARGGSVGPALVHDQVPQLVELDGSDMAAKIRAVSCYRSQLATVFGQDSPEILGRYATHVGNGRPVERYWHLAERQHANLSS